MSQPVVRYNLAGGVLEVILDRPGQRNAINRQLIAELYEVIGVAESDDAVQALVLTGNGSAFCAGLDLKEFTELGGGLIDALHRQDCISALARLSKPVIGAINGPAFTGGLELALACDFLIASDRALFADTHGQVGVLPSAGMTARLPALVGEANARRMSMTGEVVDAAAAWRMGLVSEVVPHDDLRQHTAAVARTAASGPPGAVIALKRMYVEASRPRVAHARSVENYLAAQHQTDWSGFDERRRALLERNRSRADPR